MRISILCIVFCIHFIDWETIIYGIIGSLLAVMMYNFCLSFRLFWRFRKLNGEYTEYDKQGSAKPDSTFFVKYSFWNLFSFGNHLVIKQKSSTRGNWESNFPISPENYLTATGNYKYSTKYLNTWGVHRITINLEDKIINVEAEAKNRENSNSYILRRNN